MNLENPGKLFAVIVKTWILWALVVLAVNVAIIGGIGYAIYWGLSIAERAVEHQVDTP